MQHVLITGANRGIGLEFARQYLARGNRVTACCRDPSAAGALGKLACPALVILPLDVGDEAAISALPDRLDGAGIDIFINNAGVYGQGQALDEVSADEWLRVLRVNTVAPLLLTRVLLPVLGRGAKLLYLSSKMGSIAENTGGSTYVYRSSKTALNQVVKSLALDLAGNGLLAAALHPGWVKTDMGGPNALIDTQTSVSGMMGVIDRLDATGSGGFFNYDGTAIPW